MSKQRASPRTVLAETRRQQAFALRVGGATYRQIAATVGVSPHHAMRMVIDRLDETRARTQVDVERLRELEAARMEGVIMALWPKRHQPGEAARIIHASERRARLYGLDAPLKLETGPSEMPAEAAIDLANLTLDELREYERLVSKASTPRDVIDVTPPRALPSAAKASADPEDIEGG